MSIDSAFEIFPQLVTQRLALREMGPSDAGALFSVLADTEVTRYYDDAAFTNVSQASQQIKAWTRGFEEKRCIRWGIAMGDDDVIVGTCGYYGFHHWHMRGALGYELARPLWRQGIMTEALSAAIDFGFQEMGLNRSEATVVPENRPSVKLLERLGFRLEGILREYEHWPGKGYVDLAMLSLLRREA